MLEYLPGLPVRLPIIIQPSPPSRRARHSQKPIRLLRPFSPPQRRVRGRQLYRMRLLCIRPRRKHARPRVVVLHIMHPAHGSRGALGASHAPNRGRAARQGRGVRCTRWRPATICRPAVRCDISEQERGGIVEAQEPVLPHAACGVVHVVLVGVYDADLARSVSVPSTATTEEEQNKGADDKNGEAARDRSGDHAGVARDFGGAT